MILPDRSEPALMRRSENHNAPTRGKQTKGDRHAQNRRRAEAKADLAVGAVFGVLAASNLVQGMWLDAIPWLDLTTVGFALAVPIAMTGLFRRTTVAQVALILLLLGALVFGYLEPALSSNAEHKRLNLLIGVAFVFVASYLSLSNPRRVRAFLVTVAALALPVVIGQVLMPDPLALTTGRRTPIGVNAIGAGRELASGFVLTLSLLITTRHRYRILLVAPLVALGTGLVLAGSRGPVLGALVALILIILRHPTLKRPTRAILLAVLALVIAFAYSHSAGLGTRLAATSTSGRQEIYSSAVHVAAARPSGIGWGNFAHFARAAQLNSSQGDNFYVHNILLEFLIEAGLAAALAFCIFLVGVMVEAWRSASLSPLGYALAALAASLLAGAMLSSDVIGNRMLWVALAGVLGGGAAGARAISDPTGVRDSGCRSGYSLRQPS